jgi:hypothetical protein
MEEEDLTKVDCLNYEKFATSQDCDFFENTSDTSHFTEESRELSITEEKFYRKSELGKQNLIVF